MSWDNVLPTTVASNDAPVTTLLAASEQGRVDAWYTLLAGDARFRVIATATSLPDLNAKLNTMRPELLIVDGMVFRSASDLANGLARYTGMACVLLPAQTTESDIATVSAVPCVKRVFTGDLNLTAEAGSLYETVTASRLPGQAVSNWNPLSGGALDIPAGLRVIAVWNHVGGSGKTTLATNLAFEARRRGLKTLLVGLGAPDDTGIVLPRTKAAPNLLTWHSTPTPEGLQAAIQNVDGLDVLAGYPDVVAAEEVIGAALEGPASLQALVVTAALSGYSVIILDAPALERAAPVLAAANQLLLVARPTINDALRSVEAYRTVTERLAGKHRIPPQGIRVALNQTRPDLWSPERFHAACSALQQKPFPPIVAAIPDDGRVPQAQNEREFPLLKAAAFQRAFMPLAEACLQIKGSAAPVTDAQPRRVFKLGPVKVGM